MSCTCEWSVIDENHPIMIGWNPLCPEHGTESKWYRDEAYKPKAEGERR